jgi:hypothetical protein
MARDSKSKRRRKRTRRDRNRQREADLMRSSSDQVRVRRSFAAKSRRGDEAGLDLQFSGVEVPFDPESDDFDLEAARRHEAVLAWNDLGNPTSGDA